MSNLTLECLLAEIDPNTGEYTDLDLLVYKHFTPVSFDSTSTWMFKDCTVGKLYDVTIFPDKVRAVFVPV